MVSEYLPYPLYMHLSSWVTHYITRSAEWMIYIINWAFLKFANMSKSLWLEVGRYVSDWLLIKFLFICDWLIFEIIVMAYIFILKKVSGVAFAWSCRLSCWHMHCSVSGNLTDRLQVSTIKKKKVKPTNIKWLFQNQIDGLIVRLWTAQVILNPQDKYLMCMWNIISRCW